VCIQRHIDTFIYIVMYTPSQSSSTGRELDVYTHIHIYIYTCKQIHINKYEYTYMYTPSQRRSTGGEKHLNTLSVRLGRNQHTILTCVYLCLNMYIYNEYVYVYDKYIYIIIYIYMINTYIYMYICSTGKE
jgi:hypothetical protein